MEKSGTDRSLRLPNYGSDQESGTCDPSILDMEDHENQEIQSQVTIRRGTPQPGRPANVDPTQQNQQQIQSNFQLPFRPHPITELNRLASQLQQQQQHEQTLINPSSGCYPRIRTPQPVITPPNFLCFCPRCLNERRARRVIDGGYSHQLARLGSSDGGVSSSGQAPSLTFDRVTKSRYNEAPFLIPNDRGQSQPRFSDNQTQPQLFQNVAVSTYPAVPAAHTHSRPTLPLSMSNRLPLELSRSQQLIDGFNAATEALLVLLVEMGVPNPMGVACDGIRQIWQEILANNNMNFPSPGQPLRQQL